MTTTLGWEVAEWIARYLPSPADPAQLFILSPGELDVVLAWYEVDQTGAFVYRRGALQAPKGWGKSPMLAAVAIAEFVGPTLFDHWEDGRPKGRPGITRSCRSPPCPRRRPMRTCSRSCTTC